MSTDVKDILEQIQRLPEAKRLELRAELDRQDEQEWPKFVAEAREQARLKGLDDDAIARLIESERYPENDRGR